MTPTTGVPEPSACIEELLEAAQEEWDHAMGRGLGQPRVQQEWLRIRKETAERVLAAAESLIRERVAGELEAHAREWTEPAGSHDEYFRRGFLNAIRRVRKGGSRARTEESTTP